ncbi:hypothetical protein [Halalkalibacter nanhaiisediminis]|uniref:Phenylalanyl-tRNA synthetase subunit beta n=1 Tax=Halalkalibacter nanhaiisediminis TaxID=688079 RepID=A0A562QEU9_9BACI|nr:hypothetical protein [Halalkalibacter nanhaiisediminis]TWI55272.1 hypothetical protein IQ10_02819 [Halalkalibacter nanhaiisediminis]
MWKWILGVLLILGVAGYFGYNFAISTASDIMIDQVANQVLSNEEELEKLMNDPEIQALISSVDVEADKELPFETKEEALTVVLSEFSMGEITDVASKAQTGELSPNEVQEMLEQRLSSEEMEALKIIAVKEIQSRQNQ